MTRTAKFQVGDKVVKHGGHRAIPCFVRSVRQRPDGKFTYTLKRVKDARIYAGIREDFISPYKSDHGIAS